MTARLALVKVVGSVLELLLPSRCAGCGRCDGAEFRLRGLCPQCVAAVRQSVPVTWEIAVPGTRSVVPSFAAGAYDGVIRAALLDYKERGRLCLRRELGGSLAVSVFAAVASDDSSVVLVPVPSAIATRRARGHDPVGAMAATAARYLRATGWRSRFARSCGRAERLPTSRDSTSVPAAPISAAHWSCGGLRWCRDAGW